MRTLVNRSDDLYEILNDGTYGMQGALKPTLTLYEDTEGIGDYYSDGSNALIIKPYTFDREIKKFPNYETRRWSIDCILIAESWDKLEDYLDEVVRVINVYNAAPRAENSHTYDELIFVNMGLTSAFIPKLHNVEFTVILVQYHTAVVIS